MPAIDKPKERSLRDQVPVVTPRLFPYLEDEVFTVREFAAMMKQTPRWVLQRVRSGKIAHLKDGRKILFRPAHVQEYFESIEKRVTRPGGRR